MIAVDTNVVVRLLIDSDDPKQSTAARELFEANDIAIPLTVVLETEWVLRTSFRIPRNQVLQALRALVGLRSVRLQSASAVIQALDWSSQGIDFADALHLAVAEGSDRFVTFDRKFARQGKNLEPVAVVLLRDH